MRTRYCVLLALFVCLPALAQTALTVTPSQIYEFSVEDDTAVTVTGSSLLGTASTEIVFSGPAGTFSADASGGTSQRLLVWVPPQVTVVSGTYSVSVRATDVNASPRTISGGTLNIASRPQP